MPSNSEPAARRQRLAPTQVEAILICGGAVLTALVSAGLCAAAILVPAPAAVVPLVACCCVGCPMFASWRLPVALSVLRAGRPSARALAELRRSLEGLPETEHPLGL